jgi:hypothetical protein
MRVSINPARALDRRGKDMTKSAKRATKRGFQSTGAGP